MKGDILNIFYNIEAIVYFIIYCRLILCWNRCNLFNNCCYINNEHRKYNVCLKKGKNNFEISETTLPTKKHKIVYFHFDTT